MEHGEEAPDHEVLESLLELGRDRLRHRLRAARPLGLGARGPAGEVDLALGGPLPHRDRVDQVLEALGQRDAHRLAALLRLDEGRQVPPPDDPNPRHVTAYCSGRGPARLTSQRAPRSLRH